MNLIMMKAWLWWNYDVVEQLYNTECHSNSLENYFFPVNVRVHFLLFRAPEKRFSWKCRFFTRLSLSLFHSMRLNYRFHWYSFNCILCTLCFLLEHVSMCLSIYLLSIPYESESRVLFCFQSLLLFFFVMMEQLRFEIARLFQSDEFKMFSGLSMFFSSLQQNKSVRIQVDNVNLLQ